MTKIDELEKLADLKKKGILNEEEFEAQKNILLERNLEENGQSDKISAWDRYIGCFKKYATFKGRANRAEYWWFYLFNILASILFGILPFAGTGYYLISLVPGMAVSVRRLHDINRSGWWYFGGLIILCAICIIGGVIIGFSASFPETEEMGYFSVVMIALSLIVLLAWAITYLIFTLLPGTKGPNKYGDIPA